jgi:alanine racemase
VHPYPRTWIDIDLGALAHNLGYLRERLGAAGSQIALVAKADAYGHGLVPVARRALAHGAAWIAVATVQEGIALRDAGVEAPVLVVSPVLPVEAEQAVFYRLRVPVECAAVAEALSGAAVAQRTQALLHLKIDTGLSLFGCLPEEAPRIAAQVRALPGVDLEGAFTHFADSGRDAEFTRLQIARFRSALDGCEQAGHRFKVRHAANSAGALWHPEPACNLVRIGIAAYGVDPYGFAPGGLRPVMSWYARVMALRDRAPGTDAGYSRTFRTSRPTRIATIGAGYGDGYSKALSNRGVVAIGEREAPVIGLVCMDQTMIDVTDAGPVALGDTVTLIGGPVTVARLAEIAGTNAHEIVTRIMSRVPRRFVGG